MMMKAFRKDEAFRSGVTQAPSYFSQFLFPVTFIFMGVGKTHWNSSRLFLKWQADLICLPFQKKPDHQMTAEMPSHPPVNMHL